MTEPAGAVVAGVVVEARRGLAEGVTTAMLAVGDAVAGAGVAASEGSADGRLTEVGADALGEAGPPPEQPARIAIRVTAAHAGRRA